jgi:hypothetical protein
MKRLFFLLLLATVLTSSLAAEAKPVTIDGVPGFFLNRDDMEKAVMDIEKYQLLQRDYAALRGFYYDKIKDVAALQDKLEKQTLLTWIFGGTTVVGIIVAFILGALAF